MENSISLKNRSVCITGGTGFIGSHLSRRLVDEGASVSIITEENAPQDLISNIRDKVNLYQCNITDSDSLVRTVNQIRPEIVYHLAAKIDVGAGFEVIDPLIEVNLRGTINMLKASTEVNVSKFVFIGTSDVYGPTEEASSEDSPLDPISPYGASKAAAEFFVRQCNIPWVILRPFIIYGGGQSHGMFIPQLILSALKGEEFSMTAGEQTRDFLYIDDFIDACIMICLNREIDGTIFNIASGKEVSLADVVNSVMPLLDDHFKVRFGAIQYRGNERWRVRADISKAGHLLGWEPKTSLTEGLKKTFRWYNNYERV
jgi:nucleoside-diphosphate-sugar epimerase